MGSEVLILFKGVQYVIIKIYFDADIFPSLDWGSLFCVCVCVFNTLIEVLLTITKGRYCEHPRTSVFLDTHVHFLLGRYLGVKWQDHTVRVSSAF